MASLLELIAGEQGSVDPEGTLAALIRMTPHEVLMQELAATPALPARGSLPQLRPALAANDPGEMLRAEGRERQAGTQEALGNIPISPLAGAVAAAAPSVYDAMTAPVEGANPEAPNMLASLDNLSLGGLIDSNMAYGLLRAGQRPESMRPAAKRRVDLMRLPADVMTSMAEALRNKGYDVRGAEDAWELMQRPSIVKGNKFVHPDWQAAYAAATVGKGETAGQRAKRAMARKPRRSEESSRVNWDAINGLPVTESPELAGYINPNGELIDLSGGSGMRAEDHRIAGGTAGMQELVGRHGYIRWMPEGRGLDVGGEPTPYQLKQIQDLARRYNGELVLDLSRGIGEFDARNGYYRDAPGGTKSLEFRRGTDPGEIIDAILQFYQD